MQAVERRFVVLEEKKAAEEYNFERFHTGILLENGEIKLTRKDSPDGRHRFIPVKAVASISGNRVKLSNTAEQARKTWRIGEKAGSRSSEKGALDAVQINDVSKSRRNSI